MLGKGAKRAEIKRKTEFHNKNAIQNNIVIYLEEERKTSTDIFNRSKCTINLFL